MPDIKIKSYQSKFWDRYSTRVLILPDEVTNFNEYFSQTTKPNNCLNNCIFQSWQPDLHQRWQPLSSSTMSRPTTSSSPFLFSLKMFDSSHQILPSPVADLPSRFRTWQKAEEVANQPPETEVVVKALTKPEVESKLEKVVPGVVTINW